MHAPEIFWISCDLHAVAFEGSLETSSDPDFSALDKEKKKLGHLVRRTM